MEEQQSPGGQRGPQGMRESGSGELGWWCTHREELRVSAQTPVQRALSVPSIRASPH